MTHTSTEQPEINELCQWFNEGDGFKQGTAAPHKWVLQANSEIFRQHARIAELEEQLAATVTVDVPMVPHGWKLVPVEPTEKMIIEGGCAQKLKDGHRYIGECAAKTVWSFMLAATPQPPACNQSMQPELATYSAQARNKKGIEQ